MTTSDPGHEETIGDALIVHTILLCWLMPVILGTTGVVCLPWQGTRTYACVALCLYSGVKVLVDRIDLLPESYSRTLKIHFRQAVNRYFRLQHLTPSIIVPAEQWERPQVILTGPHGVFNMGGIRSIINPELKDTNIVCAIAPVMAHTWFEPILRLAGSVGMLPLDHQSITSEMSRNKNRDIMVIPGGFVEANTGNDHFSTMDDSKWEYWLLQCLRHGYDASFQWIHGATQVYHTGTYGLTTRMWFGKMGIPCVIPFGKYGIPIAHNDVGMSVCGFRINVQCVPDSNRSSPEFHALVRDFRTRVSDLLSKYPPNRTLRQAPIKMISSL
jgi:hypothetical protein